jgi:glycine oxidase
MHDVVVIGGGVIGLSIARELAGRKSVLVLDRSATGQGTSRAAAGMLTPLSEADDAGCFFQLCRASHLLFEDFVEALEQETGVDCGFSRDGLLLLASTEDAAAQVQKRFEWQRNAGFEVELISAEHVCKLEPLVTAKVMNALYVPGECSVTPRQLVNALRESCYARGVEIRTGLNVESVSKNAVRLDRTTIEANSIIIASGVWSGDLDGLEPPIPVFPRKGQILSLAMPAGAFRHMIRWQHSYLVPRSSGEMVVGATNEDAGFDLSITPGGIGQLLAEAVGISSHLKCYPIVEMWAGLRPATPDGLPILGPSAIPTIYYATGHYRNGILLAPITATIMAAMIDGREPPIAVGPYAPSRFAHQRHV